MVQYSHVPGGLKPKRRVVVSKALAKLSPRSISERRHYKPFVAKPVDPESICFTNLPCEIRLMIWRACLESRVVTICAHPRRNWLENSGDYEQAISSIHATLPITLSINKESRFETLLHYSDLIQNPEFFREPVYFNPKLDKLAIHLVHKGKSSPGLPQLYYRGRKWRITAAQCLCETFRTLAAIAVHSPSMCKLVRFLISPQGVFCFPCKDWDIRYRQYFKVMEKFHELNTIVHQSPNVNGTMVLENISKQGRRSLKSPAWEAIKSMENFEDKDWRIMRTDDYNVPLVFSKTRHGRSTKLI